MQKSHPKYILKEGDTIQSLTELFGVDEDKWKRYHSNMSRLQDIILNSIPKHLKEIYLLPDLWDMEKKLNTMPTLKEATEKRINQHILFGYQNTLPIRYCPKVLYYGVMLILFENEKVNTIKYEISMRWIRHEGNYQIIEVNKVSDTFINDTEPDLMADELAVKVSATLYPLELIISRKKGIVGINNFDAIQKRWEKTKQKIREFNSGDIIEKYLYFNDKSFDNKEVLLRCLRNDYFLRGYFNKIYETYTNEYSFKNVLSFPFIFDTKEIDYTVEQKIEPIIDEQGYIHVEMRGICTEERSKADLINNSDFPYYRSEDKLAGDYFAKYNIESKFNTIDAFLLECSLELNSFKKVSLVVTRIPEKSQKLNTN